MISYIKGALGAVEDDVIVVETGGIGLAVHVPLSLLEELPALGEEVTVYTYFQVREDAMTLYGFLHRQDREMFKQLIGVNGIGPKGALGILSIMRPDDLRIAIVSGDAKAISKAPGIGAKTAQRLILDLKDKVDLEEVMMASFGGGKEDTSGAGTGASVAGMAAAAKEAEAAAIAQAAPAQAEKTEQLRLYPVAGRPTPRWNAQPNSVYISPASSILLWSYSWIILLLTEKISGERSMALIISPI